MKRLSPVAALMLVNVYCCILLGLVLRALDPATDWADGFPALMLFFCCVTGPVSRLAIRSSFGGRRKSTGQHTRRIAA